MACGEFPGKTSEIRTALLVVGLAAVGTTLTFAEARHGHVRPPQVPAKLEAEPGNEAFLVGHATGTQNSVCLPLDAEGELFIP